MRGNLHQCAEFFRALKEAEASHQALCAEVIEAQAAAGEEVRQGRLSSATSEEKQRWHCAARVPQQPERQRYYEQCSETGDEISLAGLVRFYAADAMMLCDLAGVDLRSPWWKTRKRSPRDAFCRMR